MHEKMWTSPQFPNDFLDLQCTQIERPNFELLPPWRQAHLMFLEMWFTKKIGYYLFNKMILSR